MLEQEQQTNDRESLGGRRRHYYRHIRPHIFPIVCGKTFPSCVVAKLKVELELELEQDSQKTDGKSLGRTKRHCHYYIRRRILLR